MLKKYKNDLEENMLLLSEIYELKDDWDAYGAERIPFKRINLAMGIIQDLPCQPLISPTGRGTIYMQYENTDEGFLGFEVFDDSVVMCRVGGNHYLGPHVETISEDIIERLTNAINEFIL